MDDTAEFLGVESREKRNGALGLLRYQSSETAPILLYSVSFCETKSDKKCATPTHFPVNDLLRLLDEKFWLKVDKAES